MGTGAQQYTELAARIKQVRREPEGALTSSADAEEFLERVIHVLFPRSGGRCAAGGDIAADLLGVERRAHYLLAPFVAGRPDSVIEPFMQALPDLALRMQDDAQAMFKGDPAADSVDEVILAYPGFYAIAVYRIAHEFYCQKVPIFPRLLTETAHRATGIDIHPGARIGKSFFIDHGTGIVIGETTEIGEEVKIYQGVTLGALSVEKSLSCSKRHPTLEDRVVVYANATILGGTTVIGHDSVIGGNVWLTASVPAFSVVYHRSEVKVKSSKEEVAVPE